MNLLCIFIFDVILLSTFCATKTHAYYTSIKGEEDNPNLCAHVKHYIVNPNVTCCMSKKINPGLPVEEFWDACVTQGDENETIEQTSWRIYTCFIRKGLSKDGTETSTISLAQFANLIASSYPDEIKSKIISALESFQTDTLHYTEDALLSEIEAVNKIRMAYYDVERQVCSEYSSITPADSERGCEIWEEENSRGGLCCLKNKSFLPFDLNYKSYFMLDFLLEKESCNAKLEKHLKQEEIYEETTNDHIANLVNMCDYLCRIKEIQSKLSFNKEGLEDSSQWEKFVTSILPVYLSNSVKQSVSKGVADAMDIEANKNETMAHEWPAQRSKNDYMNSEILSNGVPGIGEKIPEHLFSIALNCVAHKRAAVMAEYLLYNMC